VGVAADELVVDGGDGVVDVERPLFAGDLGDEHRLQKEVAELFGQSGAIVAVDGVDYLVRLLDHERFQRGQGLFSVPGTALRPAQSGHELHELFEGPFGHAEAF
jgi:hypothetical protein